MNWILGKVFILCIIIIHFQTIAIPNKRSSRVEKQNKHNFNFLHYCWFGLFGGKKIVNKC